MNSHRCIFQVLLLLAVTTFNSPLTPLFAQPTAFTVQGRLRDGNGNPLTGTYDLRLTLHSGPSGNDQIGNPVPVSGVRVDNGIFSATADFGAGPFDGANRWLGMEFSPAGANNFQPAPERTPILASPYSILAASAANVGNGAVVKSLNGLKDTVTLAEGNNVTFATNGNTLTINSSGGGGGGRLDQNDGFVHLISDSDQHNGYIGVTSGDGLKLFVGPEDPADLTLLGGYLQLNGETDISSGGLSVGGASGNYILQGGPGVFLEYTGSAGSLYAYNYHNNTSRPLALNVNGGNVGVGTASPTAKLDVNGNVRVTSPLGVSLSAADGPLISRGWDLFGSGAGNRAGHGRWGLFMEFGALVNGIPDQDIGYREYQVARFRTDGSRDALLTVGNDGMTTVKAITITGGADIAEPFDMASTVIPKGAVVVIDGDHAGQLTISTRAYDTRVAGVVSGANGIHPGLALHQEGALDKGQNVALTGRVYVQADAAFGAIRPGDLLTSSGTAGHAMKVTDRARAQGAILGKAMSPLTAGKGMVLMLVTLQ